MLICVSDDFTQLSAAIRNIEAGRQGYAEDLIDTDRPMDRRAHELEEQVEQRSHEIERQQWLLTQLRELKGRWRSIVKDSKGKGPGSEYATSLATSWSDVEGRSAQLKLSTKPRQRELTVEVHFQGGEYAALWSEFDMPSTEGKWARRVDEAVVSWGKAVKAGSVPEF